LEKQLEVFSMLATKHGLGKIEAQDECERLRAEIERLRAEYEMLRANNERLFGLYMDAKNELQRIIAENPGVE
jgi:hypothetical protein